MTLKNDCALIADILDEWRNATPEAREQAMKMLRDSIEEAEVSDNRHSLIPKQPQAR
jgi:hypothetical protein